MIDIRAAFDDHVAMIQAMGPLRPAIEDAARRMTARIAAGGKVLWMGNGGSAADCQHMAAELVGRFTRERAGLASIALTVDSSILTAIGNDYGYDAIFERQIEALCRPGDVVIGISTSGRSRNVLAAMRRARSMGACTIGLTGGSGGDLPDVSDLCLVVPSTITARIQEAHILIGHVLCDWVEASTVHRVEYANVPMS